MSLRDAIPYEQQADEDWCGAAALAMVYRSLGLEESQPDIWKRITHPRSDRATSAGSYRLGRDALELGFDALVMRARAPWKLIEAGLGQSARLIVNHRSRPNGLKGHFSVLVDLDADHVYLHDPNKGPARSWPREEFARCWARGNPGNVLIAVTPRPAKDQPYACPECAEPLDLERECSCRKTMRLRPADVIGCWNNDCPRRTWSTLFCPHCDGLQPRKQLFLGRRPFG